MKELYDLKVHINGHHTFILNQKVMCSFSGRLNRMAKQQKKKSSSLKLMEFPGGPEGFELVSRFCYNNGTISMSPSNVCILYCASVLLEMTEDVSNDNLLRQTETFMENMPNWEWNGVLSALKSCEPFFTIAESSGLINKLTSSLLAKISTNSEAPIASNLSSPSSSSSPDTPGTTKLSMKKEWWFDEISLLAPNNIEKITRTIGAYGNDNKNIVLTRFVLHYLKSALQRPRRHIEYYREEYKGLARSAVDGVVEIGGNGLFSCRGLFWVHRVVSHFGLSKECKVKLERLMGLVLDQATLDDLLVCGDDELYDVNLVVRLVRGFVSEVVGLEKIKRVGRLIDMYLREICPDQGLKVCKFLGVAESLPDFARDCFDGVYRALDIYLESHPSLSTEERTTLCRCLNYEKLTLEACKDLAKSKRIPPSVAVQALVSQKSKLHINNNNTHNEESPRQLDRTAPYDKRASPEELKFNLQRMQSRVIELEKVCRDMKGQMSKMAKSKSTNRGMTRLC